MAVVTTSNGVVPTVESILYGGRRRPPSLSSFAFSDGRFLLMGVTNSWNRLRWLAAILPAAVLLLAGCPANRDATSPTAPAEAVPAGPPFFKDVTSQSGIVHTYRNGEEAGYFAILESLGGGVALIDYDNDGLLDVFIIGGGYYSKNEEEFKKDPTNPPKIHGYPC